MPFFTHGNQNVFFFHVPRCGGSAVENYLQSRFGPLAFLNREHESPPVERRWSRTSPQHIDAVSYEKMFPPSLFAHQFTVVRHPVLRLRSVFLFQRDWVQSLPEDSVFSGWLRLLPERFSQNRYYLDNHPRRMVDLVPPGANIFRLEDGLDPVIVWLDSIVGASHGPRSIPRSNDMAWVRDHIRGRGRQPGPTPEIARRDWQWIADYYRADFKRFGYDPDWASAAEVLQRSTS